MTLLTQDEVDVLHQSEELIVRRQMNPNLNNLDAEFLWVRRWRSCTPADRYTDAHK
jgi:hypothetical protein